MHLEEKFNKLKRIVEHIEGDLHDNRNIHKGIISKKKSPTCQLNSKT